MKLKEEDIGRAVNQLGEEGYFIWTDFITKEEVKRLVQIADFSKKAGLFKEAGVGKQQLFQIDRSTRGDYIQWLDRDHESSDVREFLEKISSVKRYINESCYLGLKDDEIHFAIYPEHTFYRKHKDRFQKNGHRVISFVLYLNEHWQEGDGGELAIYLEGKAEKVKPLAGQLVLFKSELEHEVLISYKKRYSITGWMLDIDKSLSFLP